MPYVRNRLYYSDEGSGSPVVLVGAGWEEQARALRAAGHRVIGFDRRSGLSSPYGVEVLAEDLDALLEQLDLTGCVLAGSSAGAGDVVRYLEKHGSGRVRKVVLAAGVTPFLMRTDGNPDGVDEADLAGIEGRAEHGFGDAGRVDFRAGLIRLDVPVLLLHGDEDALLPIDATAHRLPDLVADLRYEVIPGGPHDLGRAEPDLVNRYMLEFCAS
ncbi:alpha/beta fold hydrolase [Paractinoplanes atraurantiacus]|uniref:Non-heme chloroperoxidase n=1 Tax=Paractinoplanes atraurantiacus TaxID=1036182 RepID=A0A285K473_9ACTN|nr:alpha/beta hydrolase [Actinoplanes atraurantiacus]SNY67355.1 non-heme chloroperoxidase [Actinoplanes atraurantiacus]